MAGTISIDVALCSNAFEPLAELQQWPHQENDAATAIFIGRMRSQGSSAEELEAMQLEHYPGMTERQLQHLASNAASSHGVRAVLLRHRAGDLGEVAQVMGDPGRQQLTQRHFAKLGVHPHFVELLGAEIHLA